MPKTKEKAPIGGPRRSVRTCDGSDSIPTEDLRAFRDVSRRGEPEGGKKEGYVAGATSGYTLADHVKS